jgi:hypothetical protein
MHADPVMARVLIRVAADVPDTAMEAFPTLTCVSQPAHTTLVGSVTDQEELHGVLHHLDDLGIEIVEVVTIPDETDAAVPETAPARHLRRNLR